MADFDRERGELHIKVLYAGPAKAGRTTSLEVLAREGTKHGRTLMCQLDQAPLEHVQLGLGRVFGRYTAFVHAVAVPSGAALDPTHRYVVRSCDAIVFVADADPQRVQDNLRALTSLEADLRREGRGRGAVPIVFQWNKRDRGQDGAAAERRVGLVGSHPVVETVATRGEGVTAAFQRACLPAIRSAGEHHGLGTRRVPRPAGTSGAPSSAAAEPHALGRLLARARALFRSPA